MKPTLIATSVLAATVAAGMLAGCRSGYTTVLPNKVESLNRKPAEFAADAAKRTFPEDLPTARTQQFRAETQYTFDTLDLVNLTGGPLNDVEVWVNRKYVVFLPTLPDREIVTIPFVTIYDDAGHHFPLNNSQVQVQSVHVLTDGELLEVPTDIAD